ncbi:hypothetical protein [Haloarcula marina]|uniref:hypothetical protein n=1 Tax=Haloarcula marina TaxID=2961574 RepID=UPI0020B63A44|nr:hypothetical protein [Halomicroarcula marina]
MSESEDSGPGRREVAHRLFAAEFDDSDFSYSESDEERAPNYVVTPTGARVNRMFVVGVLTEIENVNEEVLRARIVDPTGPFVVYAGQYQPDALAFLEAATPPLFVAVTGKARTFEPEDGDRVFTSIRPESISEVDAETRDRWVVQAAEQTVARVGAMAGAKQSALTGDELHASLVESGVEESLAAGITLALDHYGTTGDYLQAVRDLSLDAARVVSGDLDEAGSLSLSPGEGGDDPLALLADRDVSAADAASAADTEQSETEADAESPSTAETATEPAAESTTEPESAPVPESEPEPSSEPETETESTTAEQTATETESVGTADATADAGETVAPTETQTETASASSENLTADDELGDFDAGGVGDEDGDEGGADDGDEVDDFDGEFELDDDEREEIEQEYGTDFQTGTEVDDPGEADIETPDPDELAEATDAGAPAGAADADTATDAGGAPVGDESVEPDAAAATSDAPVETPETATEEAADETTPEAGADEAAEPAEDVDLEDAVMEAMKELNDGGGADREAVRETVVERYGADSDAVEDAIQDALMGGRCYEPDDGKLTPI